MVFFMDLALQETGPAYTAKPPDKHRESAGRQTQADIRATLRQALDLQALAYKVAMKLGQTDGSNEESDSNRAHAQAVAAAIKAWDTASDRARIVRGKPMPGSLRPEAKPKKPKSQAWAMVELLPPKQIKP